MPVKLNSFGIRGFRALKKFDIADLRNINLFVGKNNSGKTTILEAIRIYLSTDPRLRIFNLLTSREEFKLARRARFVGQDISTPDGTMALSFEALFSGRPDLETKPELRLGELSELPDGGLAIKFAWLTQQETTDDFQPARYQIAKIADENTDLIPGYIVIKGDRTLIGPLDRMGRIVMRRRLASEIDPNVVYLPSTGMSMREIGVIWDTIALTDEEDEVVKALKTIAPELDKIVLIQSPQEPNQRMLMAKLSNFPNPVPFKSLGEGTVHLLSIVLAIIQARDGIVLLDEIENGIHFSVQDAMWSLITDLTSKINVQVFATTHSLDCVNGFASAAAKTGNFSSKLFRLERRKDSIEIVGFSADEVKLADIEGIEIR